MLIIITPSMGGNEDISRLKRRDLPQVHFSVEENIEPGQVVGSLYDKIRLPLDRRFQFSLPSNPYFKFGVDGSLIVTSQLDRDDNPGLCKEPGYPEVCEWSSFIIDNNGKYISLRVNIIDVNDNSPSWPTHYITITIPENSSPNFTTELSAARDPDYGVNGVKKYQIIPPRGFEDFFMVKVNPFRVSTGLQRRKARDQNRKSDTPMGTPALVLLRPLDREEHAWINMTLLAVDGSPPYHTGSLKIHVRVGDENDNSPVFTFQKYVAQLPEVAAVGSTVELQPISSIRQSDDNGSRAPVVDHLEAADKDEGANGRITYSFARSTPFETQKTFVVDRYTGQLRVARPLSYDDRQISWNFQVVATDDGRPQRSSHTDVSIHLTDSNNHAPAIKVQSPTSRLPLGDYEDSDSTVINIFENVPFDRKHLATITVNDRDTDAGGEFECKLRSDEKSEEGVQISLQLKGKLPQAMIYDLLLSGTLDREKGALRTAQIFCEDRGVPQLSSTHRIQLNIGDENDNDPTFEFPFYRLTVSPSYSVIIHFI